MQKKERIEREVEEYQLKMIDYWKEKDPNFRLNNQKRKRKKTKNLKRKTVDEEWEDIYEQEKRIWNNTHGIISLQEYYDTVELEKKRWRSERFKRNLERKRRREAYLLGKSEDSFWKIKKDIYEKATKNQINVALELLTADLPENHEYKWNLLSKEMLEVTTKKELVEDAILSEKIMLRWYFQME